MKRIKSIVISGLLLLGVGVATTSCEDMFTAENNLVTTNLTPQDTVYQMMGIVKCMQKLADRTVLLGEIRADLVDVNTTVASTDFQQLYNNAVSTDNVYNKPADYYAVINNCNIYLAYVDSLLKTHGEYYYEKEICAAKCFRAWCYLELAKIYGRVPLVTEPVLTADAAESIVSSGEKADMATILDFCINDLKEYPYKDENFGLRPQYTSTVSTTGPFLYVRALLGELYLWRATYTHTGEADYINAIRMYHDYLCFPNEEMGTKEASSVHWVDRDHLGFSTDYAERFMYNSNYRRNDKSGVIPCDSSSYHGNTSDLRMVFNSQPCNNYYAWATPSQRIVDISADQDYFYYEFLSEVMDDTCHMSKDENEYKGYKSSGNLNLPSSHLVGDLRLSAVYATQSNLEESRYNSNLAPTKSFIMKWLNGSRSTSTDAKQDGVPYYRNTILYLHMAEALNRAGFPETAFAVLKYGLTYKVMENRSIISQDEFDRLCEIKSYGFSLIEPKYEGEVAEKANTSFVIWRSNVFDNPNRRTLNASGGYLELDPNSEAEIMQIGIHAIGSGAAEYDDRYCLDDEETQAELDKIEATRPGPGTFVSVETDLEEEGVYARAKFKNENGEDVIEDYATEEEWNAFKAAYDAVDTEKVAYLASGEVRAKRQARVAKLILEEEALEGVFEGYRFYDLMRYQMQEGKFTSTITLPEYMTTEKNYGETPRMTGKSWYLPLPTR